MSAAVRDEMKEAYPELEDHAARITKILDEEESRFTRTVEIASKKLEGLIESAEKRARKKVLNRS